MVLEETVHLFFIRQPFLSCWPKTQNYESSAWEIKLSDFKFLGLIDLLVYGLTKLNISVNAIKLAEVFEIRK